VKGDPRGRRSEVYACPVMRVMVELAGRKRAPSRRRAKPSPAACRMTACQHAKMEYLQAFDGQQCDSREGR